MKFFSERKKKKFMEIEGHSQGEGRMDASSRLATGSAVAAVLLICLATGVHVRNKVHRDELSELSKLALYDRWGIPIDEAVDNHPVTHGDTNRASVRERRALRQTATDKMMLKTVQQLESKMTTLSTAVGRLERGKHSAQRRTEHEQRPVRKEVVTVVHEHDRAEVSALSTIQSDIEKLIAVDTAKKQSEVAVSNEVEERHSAAAQQHDERKDREDREDRRETEIKDVEKRTMEAVRDAMARQREIDMKEAAAETERRREARQRLAARTKTSAEPYVNQGRTAPRSIGVHVAQAPPSDDEQLEEAHEQLRHERAQSLAKSNWGRRDGEVFDTYLGRSGRSSDPDNRVVRRDHEDSPFANEGEDTSSASSRLASKLKPEELGKAELADLPTGEPRVTAGSAAVLSLLALVVQKYKY